MLVAELNQLSNYSSCGWVSKALTYTAEPVEDQWRRLNRECFVAKVVCNLAQ
jgi:hypothetical protein